MNRIFLYFLHGAVGKAFCDELLTDGRVQILAYTWFKEMIRLSGKAVPAEKQEEKSIRSLRNSRIFANVYPETPGTSASFLNSGTSPWNISSTWA